MRNITSSLVLILLLSSCERQRQQEDFTIQTDTTVVDTLTVLNNLKSNINIQTNSFNEIDTSGIVMFPLSIRQTSRDRSELSYKQIPPGSYWNLVFYNSHTKEYHLLSERKMIIRNFDYKHRGETSIDLDVTASRKHIFYEVTVDDYNKDKKLTTEDPQYLFVSDRAGNNFRQISPANYSLKGWELIKSSNKVLMTLTKDTNADKEFDENDEVASFEINIDKDSAATEIFSQQFKNKLKLLYDRDWKLLKE